MLIIAGNVFREGLFQGDRLLLHQPVWRLSTRTSHRWSHLAEQRLATVGWLDGVVAGAPGLTEEQPRVAPP